MSDTLIAQQGSKTEPVARNQVNNQHPEYKARYLEWTIVTDAIAGAIDVKHKGTTYLPKPDPEDDSPEANARYKQYKQRAVYYNATGRTLEGLVGHVFLKQPIVSLTPRLGMLSDNIDGQGTSVDQLAKRCLGHVLSRGRAGVLVDYPKREADAGPATVEDLDKARVRPKLLPYSAFDIINWRTVSLGAVVMLSLVVLRESYEVDSEDDFDTECEIQYRVLRLNVDDPNNVFYTTEVWRKDGNSWKIFEEATTPLDHTGKPFPFIPFHFIGWEDNTPSCNTVPLFDLADLNLAHYRDSADYQESVFLCGQPQLVMSGITKDWVTDVWKNKGLKFGARNAIATPPGSSAELLQAQPNTLAKEAMDQKEQQMVAIGATLVEEKEVQRTATEAGQDEAVRISVLSSSADNVSEAITKALEWAGLFIGEEQGETETEAGQKAKKISYELNTDFDLAKMDAQERAQLMAEYQGQAISWTELRAGLKAAGVAFQEDKKARDEIENDPNNIPVMPTLGGAPFNSDEEEEDQENEEDS